MTDIDEFILNKLDKLDEKMDDQGRRLDEYNKQLEIHIMMSKNLQKQQNLLDARVRPLEDDHKEKQVLIKARRTFLKKVAAVLGIVATIVGIAVGISQLM